MAKLTDLVVTDSGLSSDIDTHLNTSSATSGQYLGWDGSDYAWLGTPPAGTYDFVASGTISNGDVVTLNSDGTVSVIEEVIVSEALSTPVLFESGRVEYISATYDANAQKVVVAYQDEYNSNYGTAVVGTVSGMSISFGTPVVFESAASEYVSATYDPDNQKIIIAYTDAGNSDYGTAIVGTVSGTSISFGTPVVFGGPWNTWIGATYDANAQKVVIAYRDENNANYGTAVVGTVSGTSISFGTPVAFESAPTNYISATYDPDNQKVIIAYTDAGNSDYGTAVVGTVSGTSINFGTPVVFESGNAYYISATYDPDNQKVIIAYMDNGNGARGTAVVSTVSNTSISFGTPVIFENLSTTHISITYDSYIKKIVIGYKQGSVVGSTNGAVIAGTVSGASISFGTASVFDNDSVEHVSATYDPNAQKAVITYRDIGNVRRGTAFVFQAAGTATNADDWVGIAAQDISNTATGTVTIFGGVNASQTGLTTKSTYYLADDGSLTTSAASGRKLGRALSTNKLLITEGNAG